MSLSNQERTEIMAERLGTREAPALMFGTGQTAISLYRLVSELSNLQSKARMSRDLVILLSDSDAGPRMKRVLDWLLPRMETLESSLMNESDPETTGNPHQFHL